MEQRIEKKVDVANRELQPDGIHYKRSRATHLAIDPTKHFNNRFCKLGEGHYSVVVDTRAIGEQDSGQVYTNNIVAYEVKKPEDKRKKGLEHVATKNIGADVFINEYRSRFDVNSIKKVLDCIETQSVQEETL